MSPQIGPELTVEGLRENGVGVVVGVLIVVRAEVGGQGEGGG